MIQTKSSRKFLRRIYQIGNIDIHPISTKRDSHQEYTSFIITCPIVYNFSKNAQEYRLCRDAHLSIYIDLEDPTNTRLFSHNIPSFNKFGRATDYAVKGFLKNSWECKSHNILIKRRGSTLRIYYVKNRYNTSKRIDLANHIYIATLTNMRVTHVNNLLPLMLGHIHVANNSQIHEELEYTLSN